MSRENESDILLIARLVNQRDELLAKLREILEFSTIASHEMTTVRGDFCDWADDARYLIAKCEKQS